MRILLRVDAGSGVGLGHFYRSMTLANALTAEGHHIFFIHKPSAFWDQYRGPYMHFTLQKNETQETLSIVELHHIDVYYLDGIMEVNDDLKSGLKNKQVKSVFYQNMSDSRYKCDVFILPSLNYDSKFFEVFSPDTKIYKGLAYVLLNDKVYGLPVKKKTRPFVKKVGLMSGGSDPKNVLLRLYTLMDHNAFQSLTFTYFMGQDYMHREKVPVCNDQNADFTFFEWEKITEMDLIIGTFGVIAFEMMYLGIPFMAVGHQPANALASQRLAARSAALKNLGLIDELTSEKLNTSLDSLVNDFEKREQLRLNGIHAVDKYGVDRVRDILLKL